MTFAESEKKEEINPSPFAFLLSSKYVLRSSGKVESERGHTDMQLDKQIDRLTNR